MIKMRKRMIVIIMATVMLLCGFNVFAGSKSVSDADISDIKHKLTYKYHDIMQIEESIITETGEELYLVSVVIEDTLYQATYVTEDVLNDLEQITSRIVHKYTKSIVVRYEEHTDVPKTYFYTEYNLDAWFSGTLELEKIEKRSNGWDATFTGTLSGII